MEITVCRTIGLPSTKLNPALNPNINIQCSQAAALISFLTEVTGHEIKQTIDQRVGVWISCCIYIFVDSAGHFLKDCSQLAHSFGHLASDFQPWPCQCSANAHDIQNIFLLVVKWGDSLTLAPVVSEFGQLCVSQEPKNLIWLLGQWSSSLRDIWAPAATHLACGCGQQVWRWF